MNIEIHFRRDNEHYDESGVILFTTCTSTAQQLYLLVHLHETKFSQRSVRLVLIDLWYSYSYGIVSDMGMKPQPKKLKADSPELSLKA